MAYPSSQYEVFVTRFHPPLLWGATADPPNLSSASARFGHKAGPPQGEGGSTLMEHFIE
jgi:hypothetical protein